MANPNLELLTDAAQLLGPLLGELVFVGGRATADRPVCQYIVHDTAIVDAGQSLDVDGLSLQCRKMQNRLDRR